MCRFILAFCSIALLLGCSGKSKSGPSPLTVKTSSLPDAYLDQPYGPEQIEASGGTPPYSFTEVGTSLASFGFTLNSDGTVVSSGPTTTGVCSFTVQVTDSAQPPRSTQATIQITVYTPQGYQNPPNAPSDLHTTTVLPRSVTLSWTDNSNDEDCFILQRDTDSAFTNPVEFTVPPEGGTGSAVKYTDTGVNHATQYYYRVKARNKAGDSNWTDVCAVKTPREYLLWGGADDDAAVAFFQVGSDFWLVGNTNSFNKSNGAIFFAKFDSDWNLQGSWLWSLNGYSVSASAAVLDSSTIYVAGTLTDTSTNAADILLLAFDTTGQTVLWEESLDVFGEPEWAAALVLSGSHLWVVGGGSSGQIGGQYPNMDVFCVSVDKSDGALSTSYAIGGSVLLGTVPTADVAGCALVSGTTLAVCGACVVLDIQSLSFIPTVMLLRLDTASGGVTGQTFEITNGAAFAVSLATDGSAFYLAGSYTSDLQALYNWLQNPSGQLPESKPFLARIDSSSCVWAKILDISSGATAGFSSMRLSGTTLVLGGVVTLTNGAGALRVSTSTSASTFTSSCWGTSSSAAYIDPASRLVGATSDYNGSWQTLSASSSDLATSPHGVSFSATTITPSATGITGTLESVDASTSGAGGSDALVVW